MRTIFVILLVLALPIAVVGCAQGLQDPTAPLLVEGQVVDGAGVPVAGASVEVSVQDFDGAAVGQAVEVVWAMTTLTGSDGRFAFRIAPPRPVVEYAVANGNIANFQVTTFLPGAGSAIWNFPREIVSDAWAGEAPAIRLSPTGSSEAGAGRDAVPAPMPAVAR